MRDDNGSNNDDNELSSSSYDTDKVASLFGPPPSKKYNFASSASHKLSVESCSSSSEVPQSGKNYSVEDMDATPLRSPKFRKAEATEHSAGEHSPNGNSPHPMSLGAIGKSKSLKTSTIIDSSQGVPIKMVPTDNEKSKTSPFGPPKPKMNRAPSLKRDISDKFLDITGGFDDDRKFLLFCPYILS
jgi:hypothetical protein